MVAILPSCFMCLFSFLQHWHDLRKPNGERYAYPSYLHAVHDCLRNRSEWAHLIDQGPKVLNHQIEEWCMLFCFSSYLFKWLDVAFFSLKIRPFYGHRSLIALIYSYLIGNPDLALITVLFEYRNCSLRFFSHLIICKRLFVSSLGQ